MKKTFFPTLLLSLLLSVTCLCGCRAANSLSKDDLAFSPAGDPGPETVETAPDSGPSPTETKPDAEPETESEAASVTPSPVEELTFPDGSVHPADETSLSLPDLSHGDVAAVAELLKKMPYLESVDLGSDGAWTEKNREPLNSWTASVRRPETATRDLDWADLNLLREAAPEAELVYRFVYFGRYFTTLDEEMDLNHSPMNDNGREIREILPLMRHCKRLDMDSCGVPSVTMAEIRDAYPDMEVIWRIWFARDMFTMRTDSERLWCANHYENMTDQYTQELKYLTHLRFLDLGHNLDLHDWNFIRYMPDLEVLIITASGWDTLDMLEGCTKLEYLEILPASHIELDLHPLANLTNLEHLNMCGMGKNVGWEVLLNMKKLKRLWIGAGTAQYFPEGAMEQILEALPDTQIIYKEESSAVGYWRHNPDGTVPERYQLLREQFEYDRWPEVAPFPYNDPLYYPHWDS